MHELLGFKRTVAMVLHYYSLDVTRLACILESGNEILLRDGQMKRDAKELRQCPASRKSHNNLLSPCLESDRGIA